MKLFVGLGNPGKDYQNNRHNLGQKIIIDYVNLKYNSPLYEKKSLQSKLVEIGQGTNKIVFAISTDYMNNSGVSVQKVSQFYKVSPSNIYILHDDLDLEVGDYRTQFNRGPAGHNGIKSIIESLKTQQFHRIRIGIGKPNNSISIEDYVLKPPTKEESDIIKNLTPKIFEEISKIILGP
jgi:PTH1 family peptidyl-tRNA hydrolase